MSAIGLVVLRKNGLPHKNSPERLPMVTTIHFEFKEFLRLLEAREVEYLVVGGYAVSFHGYVRPTLDFDVWVSPSEQNAKKVFQVLNEFGFPTTGMTETTLTEIGVGVRTGVPPLKLEVITFAEGLDFDAAYQNRIRVNLDGIDVNMLSLEDLKVNKRAVGRNKDLADLDHLPGGYLEKKSRSTH
jgi:Nucleotidyl transferase of unknown function (DUF2204)